MCSGFPLETGIRNVSLQGQLQAVQTRSLPLRSTTESCQEGIARLTTEEAKLPEILGIATCLVVAISIQGQLGAPSAQTQESVQLSGSAAHPTQAIPLLKNVILGKK